MDAQKPGVPGSKPPSRIPPTSSTPVINYSRPLFGHSPSSNNNSSKRPTREEKGKGKGKGNEVVVMEGERQDISEKNQPQPQLEWRDEDDGYEEDDEEWGGDEEDENDENDDNDGNAKVEEEEEEEESDDEYTELFQVLANIARMKAFDERMNNNNEGRVGSGGVVGWYHGVRYLGMGEFLKRFEEGGDGADGEKSSDEEGKEEEGKEKKELDDEQKEIGEGKEGKNEVGNGGRNDGEEEGTGNQEKGKAEQEGQKEEEDYVLVKVPGEEPDSDDEIWCLLEDSEEEKGSKSDTEGKEDKKSEEDKEDSKNTDDNKDSAERHGDGYSSNSDNEDDDDHGSDNDEWHDCPLCHPHLNRTNTSTTTTPTFRPQFRPKFRPTFQPTIWQQRQPQLRSQPHLQSQPQLQDQEQQILHISPHVDIFQTSPASYTIQLAIPGFKRRDVSIAYDSNVNVLTVSGVLYRPVYPTEDSDSNSDSSSSSSSSLDSDSHSGSERGTQTGEDGRGSPNRASSTGQASNQPSPNQASANRAASSSFRESRSDFEADLELWLAYERKSRLGVPLRVSDSSDSKNSILSEREGKKEKHEKEDDGDRDKDENDDGYIITTTTTGTDANINHSPDLAAEEGRIPIGRFSKKIYFVVYASTPSSPLSSTSGEQKKVRRVDYERLKAKLEDGILTVAVPLVVDEGEMENERTGRQE